VTRAGQALPRSSDAGRRRRYPMNHVDLVVAIAGVLITIAAIVLGAWLDLRSGPGGGESRAESRGESRGAESRRFDDFRGVL
jgi:hypothetical protein